jgi:nucleotide-binding universal stress UspA family protein
MFKAERILFPTDFSECSRSILDYVTSFVKANKGKLYLLHVIEFENLPRVAEAAKPEAPDPKRLKEAQDELETLVPKSEGVPVECMVRQGHPFNEIIRVAEKIGADIIVMATHGRTGFEQILIGSVAEKVVRHSTCPVLTVKPAREHMTHQ